MFTSSPPSYAHEQLSLQLSALSTLPVSLNASAAVASSPPGKPDPAYENALHELSNGKSVSRQDLVDVLRTLTSRRSGSPSVSFLDLSSSSMDATVQAEVMGRAVTMVWKEVLEVLIGIALELEQERSWWESSVNSRRGVGIYLVQSLPLRLYKAVEPQSLATLDSLKNFKFPSRSALFRPLPNASSALVSFTSPYALTRREMLSSIKSLTLARDAVAHRIGLLASEGPQWSLSTASSDGGQGNDYQSEIDRIYNVLCKALDVAPPTKRRSSIASSTPSASPESLLTLLTAHLPRAQQGFQSTISTHRRPSALTRLWFPLLFLPPVLLATSRAVIKNKQWLEEQIRNGKETVKGFFISWVWEPMEDIGKTLRSGGEGLGVAPTTVKSDQESLERMVLDLGRDYYHLSGQKLDQLGAKIRAGDMEEVLRVYEKEMQSPVKNALMGSLIRTLLIQVQKTKTDLSLSLLSLDHLLRSQQLTFAFVGVAPSVLVLYGLGGWLRGVWRGEKRGKTRRLEYFNGIREIERILLTAPKAQDEMTDRDRGLLIVSVTGMRTWATGLGGNKREAFLGDLRLVEDTELSRGDKLRVVERIWRCFGVDGRGKM